MGIGHVVTLPAAVSEAGGPVVLHLGGPDLAEVPDLPIEIRPNTESKFRVLIRFEKISSYRASLV
jgi:hypothetical protein